MGPYRGGWCYHATREHISIDLYVEDLMISMRSSCFCFESATRVTHFCCRKAEAEVKPSQRVGSKGVRTASGRFHYSSTGMQLPDSPLKRGGSVKYSATGMPLPPGLGLEIGA